MKIIYHPDHELSLHCYKGTLVRPNARSIRNNTYPGILIDHEIDVTVKVKIFYQEAPLTRYKQQSLR